MALIASLGTYAVGYLARPIGAVVLGHWGDRYGRKNVLVLAMLLMGISTFSIALLPTYAQVASSPPSCCWWSGSSRASPWRASSAAPAP